MSKPTTVDEYIENAPEEIQPKLKELRAAILDAAPYAEEKLSYSMPYYGYKGRLAYFGYAKNHVGFYVIPPTVDNHKEELKEYVTSKSTIQFPLHKELPVSLIKKLIKERVQWNDEHAKKNSPLQTSKT